MPNAAAKHAVITNLFKLSQPVWRLQQTVTTNAVTRHAAKHRLVDLSIVTWQGLTTGFLGAVLNIHVLELLRVTQPACPCRSGTLHKAVAVHLRSNRGAECHQPT